MSSGRRYNKKQKLNMKKVIGVIVAIVAIIMCIVSIKMLLEPKDESKATIKSAYFSAYQNGKWGVINQAGNEVIPFSYDEMILVPDSSKDIFIITSDVDFTNYTYKTKVLSQKNEEIFTDYDLVEPIDNFDESQNLWYEKNVLRVKKDGKYGLINANGVEILECKYDEITSLKGTTNSLILKKDGKVGIASNVGDVIVPVEYKEVKAFGQDYSDGYIVVSEENKQGLIGANKKTALDAIYEEIKPVKGNNLYVVKDNGTLKVINEAKETVLEDEFDDVLQIEGENFIAKKSESVGVITKSKEEKIPYSYQELSSIGNGRYIAKKDDKYGIINENNETVVEFKYISMRQRKDTDFVEAEKDLVETDIYNKNMELKVTGIISEVNTEKGYISIRVGGEQKYYNFKFEEKEAKDIFSNHTLFLSKKDGKYGYKDKDGNIVVDYIYDDAKEQNDYGYCSVKKGDVWGSLNKDGNVELEPSINLDENLVIDFIGKWYLGKDLNLYYYQNGANK